MARQSGLDLYKIKRNYMYLKSSTESHLECNLDYGTLLWSRFRKIQENINIFFSDAGIVWQAIQNIIWIIAYHLSHVFSTNLVWEAMLDFLIQSEV